MDRLAPFLDLDSYVLHLREIEWAIKIGSSIFKGGVRLKLKISYEVISTEEYYETFGYYQSLLTNVCEKNFLVKDLYQMAEDICM